MSFVYSTASIRHTGLLVLASLGALTAGSAGASDPATPSAPQALIETRQQGFKKIGKAMKSLVDQLKTAAPNTAAMTEAAAIISSGAPQVTRWFPAGSGPEAGIETDALPYIWEDRAKFDSTAERLVSEAKKLSAALSGTDLAAVRVQAKAVGEVCSTCHHSFRAD